MSPEERRAWLDGWAEGAKHGKWRGKAEMRMRAYRLAQQIIVQNEKMPTRRNWRVKLRIREDRP